MSRSLALAFAAFLGGCVAFGWGDDDEAAPFSPQPPRSVDVIGADGAAIGQATFTEAPHGVLIRLAFPAGALPPGWHGAHIHETGDCSDAALGFHASRSHVGHQGRVQHGLMNPAGPEPGDLPNLFVAEGGALETELFSPWLSLGPLPREGRPSLLDEDGAALVIHAGADDHLTQPIGGAGARIACAALSRQ